MHTSPGTVGAWAGGFLLCPCEPMNESLETRPLEELSLLVDFWDARLKKQSGVGQETVGSPKRLSSSVGKWVCW